MPAAKKKKRRGNFILSSLLKSVKFKHVLAEKLDKSDRVIRMIDTTSTAKRGGNPGPNTPFRPKCLTTKLDSPCFAMTKLSPIEMDTLLNFPSGDPKLG